MLFADNGNSRIRLITPDGIIHTYAGGGNSTAEFADRLTAYLPSPYALAAGATTGSYYYTEYARVRQIDGDLVKTVAGTGSSGSAGDGGPATSAQLYNVVGVASDASGNLFIADYGNGRVRKVSGGNISTFAGGGSALGDGGDPTAARLSPSGIAVDAAGALFVADSYYSRIRKVSGGLIQTVAGGGSLTADGSPAMSASISPQGPIAVDASGTIYFAYSNGIAKVGSDGLIHYIVQNTNSIRGLAVDNSGNIYYSDYYGVRKLTPAATYCTYNISTPATQTSAGGSLSIAVTTTASCGWTAVVDPSITWISVSSGQGSGNANATVNLSANTGATRTATVFVAGQPVSITQLGSGPAAQFVKTDTTTKGSWIGTYGAEGYQIINLTTLYPTYASMAVQTGAFPYTWIWPTTDVRALQFPSNPAQRTASTWYSDTSFVFDLPLTGNQVHQFGVYCLDWDRLARAEKLEILDTSGNVLDSRTLTNFGEGVYVIWNLSGHVRLRVTKISGPNAVISGSFFGGAGTPPFMVNVTPQATSLGPSQVQQFSSLVGGNPNQTVVWSINPNAGSISTTGLYTAPATITTQQTVTVTATSAIDGTTNATATVTLVPAGTPGGGTADFVKLDTTTQGNWGAAYGGEGFAAPGVFTSNPAYVVPVSTGIPYVWAANVTDVRALLQTTGSLRTAGVWYSDTTFTVDLPMSGSTHQMAVYCLDWDNLGRAERLEILDTNSNVLDTRTVSNFGGGVWVVWNVSGHVKLRVTRTTGVNAVLSGIFFGGDGALPVSVAVNPSTVSLSAGQTQTFTATVTNATNTTVTWSLNPNLGSISGGVYTAPSSITSTQTVTVTAASQAVPSKYATATVTLMPGTSSSSGVATFVKQDITTQGTWKGTYSTDGFNVIGNAVSNPSYVTPTASGNSVYVWNANTTDIRALQQPQSTARIAGVWYAADKFVVDLPITDTNSHQFSVYCLDWDNLGRSEKLEILDASGNVLNTQNISLNGAGVWLVWNISGHAQLRVTRTGGLNAVISGIMFGGGVTAPVSVTISPATATLHQNEVQPFTATVADSTNTAVTWSINPNVGAISGALYTAPATITTQQQVTITATSVADATKYASATITLLPTQATGASAQFVVADTTTQGNWKGAYGTDGYNVINNAASYPSYVTPVASGISSYTWAASTTEGRALQQAAGSSRIAGVWYAADSFVIDLPVSDAQPHLFSVYCLDWDNLGRIEKLEMLDTSNNILDTRTVASFRDGVWLVWSVSGHVKLRVTRTAGLNAVMSGLFFR